MKKSGFVTRIMTAALALVLLFSGCAKEETPQVSFMDLKLGVSKEQATSQLGNQYEALGTSPVHLSYDNLRLFDFVEEDTRTTTMVFLNLDEVAYCYIYYIYDAGNGNEEKIRKLLEDRFGEGETNEYSGTDWKQEDVTYTLLKTDDYVSVSVY